MFKYIEYKKVETEYTVLEFRGETEDVKVSYFTGDVLVSNVVSISSEDETKIDALIASQPTEIECIEITAEEFKVLVRDSDQIKRINEQVKSLIAKKYDLADELALMKRDITDEKRVVYESYVAECKAAGDKLKAEVGY